MRKPIFLATLTALLLLLVLAAPVFARVPPQDVSIVIDTTIIPEQPTFGSFVASGPAVEAGLFCEDGSASDLFVYGRGWQSGGDFNLFLHKVYLCGDGSGTITMQMEVRLVTDGTTTANWVVIGGTGDYEGLHGTGKLAGVPWEGGGGITDSLTGQLN